MSVLIITHSKDNESVARVTDAIARKGGHETPNGKHVFLELNPCGEFFWLERSPGLPISDAIADLLLGHSKRPVV